MTVNEALRLYPGCAGIVAGMDGEVCYERVFAKAREAACPVHIVIQAFRRATEQTFADMPEGCAAMLEEMNSQDFVRYCRAKLGMF